MLRAIIIKILARINLWVGLLLNKRRAPYNSADIKTILVKRTDRIGDAVVSLPLLLELNKYFKITILTSEYNNSFMSEFFETKIFTRKPLSFIESLKMLGSSLFASSKSKKRHAPQYDMLLDLNGLRELDIFLKIRRDNLCKYYISFNMGIWNRLLDYAHPGYPVLFAKKHILDSCKELISDALNMDIDVPDFIDLSDKMESPNDFEGKYFILLNISGIDKFRGPSPKLYAEIINAVNFDGEFVIMDEQQRPHFEEFKKYIKRTILFIWIENFLCGNCYISHQIAGSISGQTPVFLIFYKFPPTPFYFLAMARKKYGARIQKILIEGKRNAI